jgi:CRISPR-associated protein Csd2
MSPIRKRYDLVYLFEVTDGNPNGDPDAGNMPRLDPDTGHGLVTDTCLKRKIRNYVETVKGGQAGYDIYVQEGAVLNRRHAGAYEALGLVPRPKKLPRSEADAIRLTRWMCATYWDIRSFGAAMSTGVNCGQVRGPVQLGLARSIEPIHPIELALTRIAVTSEAQAEAQDDNRTMGRKHIVPYGLYLAHGFVSAKLAERTGFSIADLDLFLEALCGMLEHDRSAVRGLMSARGLWLFEHAGPLGNAPAHTLFDLVRIERATTGPARRLADYRVTVDEANLPAGVELRTLL